MNVSFLKKINYFRIFKWLIGIIIVLILIIMGLFLWARQPLSSAKHQATTLAEKKVGIKSVDHFYMSDLNRTYYTIEGPNKDKQKQYVIIEKKTGSINVVNVKDGISANEAKSVANQKQRIAKLISVAPTIFNEKPAWAVSYFNSKNELNYAVIDFKSGKVLRFIANV
ncbi:hypothetical protein AKUH3B203M04_11670 [Apilactobacillus kunkeei]|nr:hypothetical protein AKUH3B203M01_09250 [Apilactobacillus kunkeei]CAI2595531.1 hypothetical protein AKUH3B203M_06840 [Apilactobacillus kunkeei]CAI2802103.1 hypothetical protein AKUH3B203M04_11670 [Apilactobacillus kunkeei]